MILKNPLLPACLFFATILMPGCGNSKKEPPKELIESAVAMQLPAYIRIESIEAENIPTQDGATTTKFKATVSPKEDLYIPEPEHGVPEGMSLLRRVNAASERTTLYGSISAQRTVDHWNLSTPRMDAGQPIFGRPRGTYPSGVLIAGSPEAAAAIKSNAEAKEKAEREAEERTEQEESAREAARKAKLDGILGMLNLGSTFEGTGNEEDDIPKPLILKISEMNKNFSSGTMEFSSPSVRSATRGANFTFEIDTETGETTVAGNFEPRVVTVDANQKTQLPSLFWKVDGAGKPTGRFKGTLKGRSLSGRVFIGTSYYDFKLERLR